MDLEPIDRYRWSEDMVNKAESSWETSELLLNYLLGRLRASSDLMVNGINAHEFMTKIDLLAYLYSEGS